MSTPAPERDIRQAAALAHLKRAFDTEVLPAGLTKGFISSSVVHTLIPLLWLSGWAGTSETREAVVNRHAIPIFAPMTVTDAPAPSKIPAPVLDPLTSLVLPVLPELSREVAIDMSAIQLSFVDDVRNQLPNVVKAQHGMLALLDKEDQNIARYTFQPPNWEADEAITDVSGQLRLLMDPPQKWSVFRALSERYGIALEKYEASAIFDVGYSHCIQSAIRRRVLLASSAGRTRVSSARLAFAADSPCGIEVLEVSLASRPAL